VTDFPGVFLAVVTPGDNPQRPPEQPEINAAQVNREENGGDDQPQHDKRKAPDIVKQHGGQPMHQCFESLLQQYHPLTHCFI